MLPTDLTVIGVGGCGKSLLRNICEHYHFMDYYMQTGNYLSCFSIDTAKAEANDDRNWTADMSVKYSSVRFEHYDLPTLAHINSIPALIKENTRETLQLPDGQIWWLHDPSRGIDYNALRIYDPRVEKNFDMGVYRLRGVSKAVFMMASSRVHNLMTRLFNRPGGSDVAIICGLGGGTGSGMFIDLARKIKEYTPNCRIWLFGLLPAAGEGSDERLNAAIALTELEELELTSSPFDNVILTPLERTDFTDYESSKDTIPVKDFSRVFPYIFANAFGNNNDEGIVRHSSGFCGFTHSSGRVVEYPIDSLRSLEQSYDDYLSLLENTITARTNLYSEVTTFIDKHEMTAAFSDAGDLEAAVDTAGDVINESIDYFRAYRREVAHLCSLWKQEIVEKLSLILPDRIEAACEFYGLSDYDRLTNLSELIKFVQTLQTCLDTGVERTNLTSRDKRLLNILSSYCACLLILGRYYVKTASLPAYVKDYYMSLLRMNTRDVTAAVRVIASEKAQAMRLASGRNTEAYALRTEITELEEERDSGLDSIALRLDGKTEDIRAFCNYQTLYTQMESFISEYIAVLKGKCYEHSAKVMAANAATNKKNKPECPPFIAKKQRYTSFPTMEPTRYPTIFNSEEEREYIATLQLLDQHLSDYFYWQYMQIYADRRKFGDGPKVDARDVANSLVRTTTCITEVCKKLNRFNDGQLAFSYVAESEEKLGSIEFGDISVVLGLFNKQRKVYAENIIIPILNFFGIENKLPDLMQELLVAESTVLSITTVIRHHILKYLDEANCWSDTISNNKERIRVLETEEENENEKVEYLSALQKLFEDTGLMLQSATELNAESTLASSEVLASDFSGETENRDFWSVVGELNPSVLSQITEDASLAQLDSSSDGQTELERIADVIRERPSEIIDPAMLGVRMHTCIHSENPARMWSFEDTALVINTVSPHLRGLLQETTNANINFMSGINQTINNQQACHRVIQNSAKPWEIGMTFVAAGNYLDNILGFGPGGSLSTAYQQGCTNILHHTLMLHEGKILVRNMLSSDAAINAAYDERTAGLNNDKRNAVRDKILRLYNQIDIKEVIRGQYCTSNEQSEEDKEVC